MRTGRGLVVTMLTSINLCNTIHIDIFDTISVNVNSKHFVDLFFFFFKSGIMLQTAHLSTLFKKRGLNPKCIWGKFSLQSGIAAIDEATLHGGQIYSKMYSMNLSILFQMRQLFHFSPYLS